MMYMSMVFVWLAVCLAFYVPAYVLTGLGLYSIADRRGIERPWLAWVPGLNLYLLGCISDQYQAMVRGKNKNKRTALLLLVFAWLILVCILTVTIPNAQASSSMLPVVLPFLAVWGVMAATVVIEFMSLYDLYVSCDPKNAVLFLVLSVIFNVTLPFFLFACRKKDLGFPL